MSHQRPDLPLQTLLDEYYGQTELCGHDNATRLGWENQQAQRARFSAFADALDLQGRRILDVGAGYGDLYDFLQCRELVCEYWATEMYQPFWRHLAARFGPERILACDILGGDCPLAPGSVDVIYCSGPFNLLPLGTLDYLHRGFDTLADLAREAVVISLLDHRSPAREEPYAYFNPDLLPAELARGDYDIECRSAYLPNDFTLIARRR